MNSSLLIAEYCVNVAHFCIHSFVEEHLGSFQHLAIINKVAMNVVEHVSLLYVGASVGYLPRGCIVIIADRMHRIISIPLSLLRPVL